MKMGVSNISDLVVAHLRLLPTMFLHKSSSGRFIMSSNNLNRRTISNIEDDDRNDIE